jgi:membrane protease YdiL (CAAX protease family)
LSAGHGAPATLEAVAPAPPASRRELLRTWGRAVGVLAAAKAVSFVEPTGVLAANLAGVAAFVFVAMPDARLRVRHEHWESYGLPWWGWRDRRTWAAWGRGLAVALAACAILFPPFFLGFWAYAELLPDLPPWLAQLVSPYAVEPRPRWPDLPRDLPLRMLVQLLVVALPEELMYRGYLQTAWARSEPGRGFRFLGARLGAGFFATQALFAAGHLVVLQPWRLATFFPGLVFGWLRERTGALAAPVLFHAISNLWIAMIEASFYG